MATFVAMWSVKEFSPEHISGIAMTFVRIGILIFPYFSPLSATDTWSCCIIAQITDVGTDGN